MAIAIADFVARLDGELVRLRAGLDRVNDRHALVRAHPEKFAPDGSTVAREVRATAHPSALTVAFTRQARQALDDYIGEYDGLEVCGGLFGVVEPDGAIVVGDVGSQATGAHRTGSTTTLPLDHCLALEDSLRNTGSPWRWLGDWHTHASTGGRPSNVDLRAWRGLREEFGKRRWLGVIATPGPEPDFPFYRPRLHAWVTTASGTKAATLIERT